MAEPTKNIAASPWTGLRTRAIEEAKKVVVAFLYLYVCYAIFNLQERMVLAEHQIHVAIFGLAVINAFIVAKVMVVAEELRFARRFQDYPLVLPILFRSVAFALLFIAFHVIEHVVVGLVQGRTLAESIPAMGGGGIGGFVTVATIVSVMLLPYFAYRELGRVIGEDVLHGHLFRHRWRG